MKKRDLRLLSLSIKNVAAIEEMSLDLGGRGVVVKGPNGTGKSSLLKAIQAGLSGGSLAKIVRLQTEGPEMGQPAGEPEIAFVLDGPGGHYRIEKKGDKTARVLEREGDSQAFKEVGKPQAWLSGLFDVAGCNPVTLLTAKPADLARLILEAIPLEMDEAALDALLFDVAAHRKPILRGMHPLEALGQIREQLYDARTGTNRDAKGKRDAAEQTKRTVPADIPADPGPEILALDSEVTSLGQGIARDSEAAEKDAKAALEGLAAAHALATQKVNSAHKAAVGKLQSEHDSAASALRAELEQRIAELRAATEAEIATRLSAKTAAAAALSETAQGELDKLDTETEAKEGAVRQAREALAGVFTERRADLAARRERLVELRAKAEARQTHIVLDAQVKRFEADAAAHQAESDKLTAAIDRLDSFTTRLADDLPIRGLSIKDKAVTRGGIPWDQLNEGQRAEIVVQVAVLRGQDNPFKGLFLDGLEKLDTKHRTALLDEVIASGMQPFGAVVTDGDLEIQYVGMVTGGGK